MGKNPTYKYEGKYLMKKYKTCKYWKILLI